MLHLTRISLRQAIDTTKAKAAKSVPYLFLIWDKLVSSMHQKQVSGRDAEQKGENSQQFHNKSSSASAYGTTTSHCDNFTQSVHSKSIVEEPCLV